MTVESPALALLMQLPKLPERVHDLAVPGDPAWHEQLEIANDALDACREADAVVIMTPWQEFVALDPAELARRMRGKVIIDPHGLLDPGAARGGRALASHPSLSTHSEF